MTAPKSQFLTDIEEALGRGNTRGDVLVARSDVPGGGSNDLCWVSRERMLLRVRAEAYKRREAQERSYHPYAPTSDEVN